jgi:hypothetical protein
MILFMNVCVGIYIFIKWMSTLNDMNEYIKLL